MHNLMTFTDKMIQKRWASFILFEKTKCNCSPTILTFKLRMGKLRIYKKLEMNKKNNFLKKTVKVFNLKSNYFKLGSKTIRSEKNVLRKKRKISRNKDKMHILCNTLIKIHFFSQ